MKKYLKYTLSGFIAGVMLISCFAYAATTTFDNSIYDIIEPYNLGVVDFNDPSVDYLRSYSSSENQDNKFVIVENRTDSSTNEKSCEYVYDSATQNGYLHIKKNNALIVSKYSAPEKMNYSTNSNLHMTMDLNVTDMASGSTGGEITLKSSASASGGTFLTTFKLKIMSYQDKFVLYTDTTSDSGLWLGNGALPRNKWLTLDLAFNFVEGKVIGKVIDRDTGKVLNAAYQYDLKADLGRNFYYLDFRTNTNTMDCYLDNFNFTFDKLLVKTKQEITEQNNYVFATAQVENKFKSAVDAPIMYLCLYDSNKKLIGITSDSSEFLGQIPGQQTASYSCLITKPASDYTAKALLFRSTSTLKPIAKVVTK